MKQIRLYFWLLKFEIICILIHQDWFCFQSNHSIHLCDWPDLKVPTKQPYSFIYFFYKIHPDKVGRVILKTKSNLVNQNQKHQFQGSK